LLLLTLDNCHKENEETVPVQKHHRNEPLFKDILQVFEAMLCFNKWLRKDSYWSHEDAEVIVAIVKRSIAKLMHLSKKYIPTSNQTAWHFPRFHEFMHIVDDMSRFDATQNFCAQHPESLLIAAAKQTGRPAQKQIEGVVYKLQGAQQLCYSLMINTVHDCIQNGTPAFPSDQQPAILPNQSLFHKTTQG
jgi:hypothetical protein